MAFEFEKINPEQSYVILSAGKPADFHKWLDDRKGSLSLVTHLVVTRSDLGNAELERIIKECPNLKVLVLSSNKITALNLKESDLPSLTSLQVSHNDLEVVEVFGNRSQLSINLVANPNLALDMTDVKFSQLHVEVNNVNQLTGEFNILNIGTVEPTQAKQLSWLSEVKWGCLNLTNIGGPAGFVISRPGGAGGTDITKLMSGWLNDNNSVLPEGVVLTDVVLTGYDADESHYEDGRYIQPKIVKSTKDSTVDDIVKQILEADGRVRLDLSNSKITDSELAVIPRQCEGQIAKVEQLILSPKNVSPDLSAWKCHHIIGTNSPNLKHVILNKGCTFFVAPWSTVSSLEQPGGKGKLLLNVKGTRVTQLDETLQREGVVVHKDYTVLDPSFISAPILQACAPLSADNFVANSGAAPAPRPKSA